MKTNTSYQSLKETQTLAALFAEKVGLLSEHQEAFSRIEAIDQEICSLIGRGNGTPKGETVKTVTKVLEDKALRICEIARSIDRPHSQVFAILKKNPELFYRRNKKWRNRVEKISVS